MSNSEILKKYVCVNPFEYLDVQPKSQWICCPSWAPSDIRVDQQGQPNTKPIDLDEDLLHNWRGPTVVDIRKSVLDGSYRYCDHNICPQLSSLINTSVKPTNFVTQEEARSRFNITSIEDVENYTGLPEEVLFGFDRSCNLKCPSCRADLVANDDPNSKEHKTKLFLLYLIERQFAAGIKKLYITGSGDPFYSKIYRDYLINFDTSKYPNLEDIQIITNGQLLNEKMWNSLKANPFIKTIEISIDAGTKHTYENITRLNGDWDRLIENIKFLSTVKTIKNMIFSMVVSEHNYKEMLTLYSIIKDIFKDSSIKATVNLRQLVHWSTGAYSIIDVSHLSVFNPLHSKFEDFLIELGKVKNLPGISHNFHHLEK